MKNNFIFIWRLIIFFLSLQRKTIKSNKIMKLYEVKAYCTNKHFMSRFFEDRKDAKEFANSFRYCRVVVCRKKIEVFFHHTALSKGYISKKNSYIEPYDGRFRKGVIRHCPNTEYAVRGNKYHTIEYYLLK